MANRDESSRNFRIVTAHHVHSKANQDSRRENADDGVLDFVRSADGTRSSRPVPRTVEATVDSLLESIDKATLISDRLNDFMKDNSMEKIENRVTQKVLAQLRQEKGETSCAMKELRILRARIESQKKFAKFYEKVSIGIQKGEVSTAEVDTGIDLFDAMLTMEADSDSSRDSKEASDGEPSSPYEVSVALLEEPYVRPRDGAQPENFLGYTLNYET
ncbi:hypothetical protein GCK72_015219 [Caenorhabditis remanei]|uniref:Uncharacterized protein n=1 Tax=Caenorhabditis remanei TaxID=31234 RepID=E3MU83_CAERE|nr:hypothetical protein GCK72_015219 [Caenorhabditis remanei]EFP09692.1 hypothetical protein CRE_21842 [Caenorhabditis remanei]KAF1758759.1 hypothetical protein GCK72_015219 [Caenorhabditis remanei]